MKYLLLIVVTLVNISLMYGVTQQNKEITNKFNTLQQTKCVIEIDSL